jgi:hypothetical protein
MIRAAALRALVLAAAFAAGWRRSRFSGFHDRRISRQCECAITGSDFGQNAAA